MKTKFGKMAVLILCLFILTGQALYSQSKGNTKKDKNAGNSQKELTAEDFYDKACEAMEEKDYIWAISMFSDAIKLDPNFAYAYAGRAEAMSHNVRDNDDIKQILDDCNKAISLDRTCAPAYQARALIDRYLGNYDQVISDSAQLIRLISDCWIGYFLRGLSYYEKNEYVKSIADFEMALKINPENNKDFILDLIKEMRSKQR